MKVIRMDDVSVSIFARTRQVKGDSVTFYSASFSRSYEGADGKRQYTKSFDEGDLGKVMALAKEAGEYILRARGLTTAAQED